DVAIPDVTQMEYEEAARKLEEQNLNLEQEFIHTDQLVGDLVVRTNSKSGRTVKEDSNVAIYVSDGKEKVVYKAYIGRDFNQVKRLLEDKGYEDIIAYEKHSDKPVGEIITQIQPSPDSEVVPDEASVIFEISNGPELVTLTNLK